VNAKSVLLHATVHGRTQGVGFRAFVRDRARSLGLMGYVRNLSDGVRVEVVAEGPQEPVDLLLAALRHGPPMAQVERVDVGWGSATGDHSSFEVR